MDVNQTQTENHEKNDLKASAQEEEFEQDNTGLEIEEEEILEPFDPLKIKIDTRQMTVDLFLNRIRRGEIELSPAFHRSGVWDDGAKSRLIESMLIRIPLPSFYIDATDEDKWIVVDGQQRLNAIKQFVLDGELRLSKLEFFTQFNGLLYSELPRSYQRRIIETLLTASIIEKGTPPETKFIIFRRINTGGYPLSSQEIRYALNQGKASLFLTELAHSEAFIRATSGSIPTRNMADCEIILRALAFKIIPYNQYHSRELDSFLNQAMREINRMSDQELENLEKDFLKAMVTAHRIFGDNAFRKNYSHKESKARINKALFEIWSVNLSQLDDEKTQMLIDKKESVNRIFIELMDHDSRFNSCISQNTWDTSRVIYRFEIIKKLIEEVLGD